MTRKCPECGSQLPNDAKFCGNCGYSFKDSASNNAGGFLNSKIVLILIIAAVILAALFAFSSNNNNTSDVAQISNSDDVEMTITDISGYTNDYDDKSSYTFYTEALFTDVPSDLDAYIIRTGYYDANDTLLGQETEKLSQVYYDTDYAISFGHYTSYKILDVDHVNVEIIKSSNVVDNFTQKIDTNKIDFLN